MALIWLVDSTDRFVIVAWSGEAIVYDALSNQTHLLGVVAYEILLLLQSRQMSREDLILELGSSVERDSETSLEELADVTLRSLQRIGMVHTVTLESR